MTDLGSLAARIVDGSIEVIDLTSPLHAANDLGSRLWVLGYQSRTNVA